MNEPGAEFDSDITRELRIEAMCERYEEAWREGRQPEIARCLEEVEAGDRAAAQVRHPHVVAVHEIGSEQGLVYIVSDYIEGESLAAHLARNRRMAPRKAAELCVTIADALHAVHEAGVIHRDLKPSNILLDARGETHLVDFGLAKREQNEITMTVHGDLPGTPAYMSPEQAARQGHLADQRADVYSLGTILFELLTGTRPFRGEGEMLLRQVREDEPPRLRRLVAEMPLDPETACLKCLEKDPARRYTTMRDLSDDLGRFLRGEPILARPVGSWERLVRPVGHPQRARGPRAARPGRSQCRAGAIGARAGGGASSAFRVAHLSRAAFGRPARMGAGQRGCRAGLAQFVSSGLSRLGTRPPPHTDRPQSATLAGTHRHRHERGLQPRRHANRIRKQGWNGKNLGRDDRPAVVLNGRTR